MVQKYIPEKLQDICSDKIDPKVIKSSRVIIHPFIKNTDNGVDLVEITGIPKIFKNDKKININELCYRDTFYSNDGENEKYYRQSRKPLRTSDNGYIEIVTTTNVNKDCFPYLCKYDKVRKYSKYSHRVNSAIYFEITEMNNKMYFSINILSVKSLTVKNIKKINDFIKKNIDRYVLE